MKKNKILFIFTLVLITAAGCQNKSATNSSSIVDNKNNIQFKACINPRATMCTREFKPVCAVVDTNVRCVKAPCPSSTKKTASNACTACSDPNVSGYSSGVCQ